MAAVTETIRIISLRISRALISAPSIGAGARHRYRLIAAGVPRVWGGSGQGGERAGRWEKGQNQRLLEQDLLKELQSTRVAGLAQPKHRLLAHDRIGIGSRDLNEQRHAFTFWQL